MVIGLIWIVLAVVLGLITVGATTSVFFGKSDPPWQPEEDPRLHERIG